jgi:dolichol kinase
MKSGQIKEYSKKYAFRLSAFVLLGILACIRCIWIGVWRLIPILIVGAIWLLILLKTLQRTIREKYASHLVYVPMVMGARGL